MEKHIIKVDPKYEHKFNQLLMQLRKVKICDSDGIKKTYGEYLEKSVVTRVPNEYHALFSEMGDGDVKKGMYLSLLISNALVLKEQNFDKETFVMERWSDIRDTIALLYDNNHAEHLSELTSVIHKFLVTGKLPMQEKKEDKSAKRTG